LVTNFIRPYKKKRIREKGLPRKRETKRQKKN